MLRSRRRDEKKSINDIGCWIYIQRWEGTDKLYLGKEVLIPLTVIEGADVLVEVAKDDLGEVLAELGEAERVVVESSAEILSSLQG